MAVRSVQYFDRKDMAHRRCYGLFHFNGHPSVASVATQLSAPHVPTRKLRFHKAYCIIQSCDTSNCIVLFNANFIEIAETRRYVIQRSLKARFLLSRMTARSLGHEQNAGEHENRDD
jgi:hypothetical protein